jgi:hypothetical protein
MPSFTVTAAGQTAAIDASGAGQAAFTVTNTTGQTVRGRVIPTPQPPAVAEWFKVQGEALRPFAPGTAEQVTVDVKVPPGTAAGKYAFRLDVVAEENPDEDFTQGPSVSFDVAPSEKKKPFPIWIPIVALLVLIGGGLAAWLLTRGDDDKKSTQTITTVLPPRPTVTIEAEDLLPASVDVTTGDSRVELQETFPGVTWFGHGQAFFINHSSNNRMTLRPFDVPAAGLYRFGLVFTTAPDYGKFQVFVDGRPLGSAFDAYTPTVRVTQRDFGSLNLASGHHTFSLKVSGRNPSNTFSSPDRYYEGVDRFTLTPIRNIRIVVPSHGPRLTLPATSGR